MDLTKYFFEHYEISEYPYYDKYAKNISIDKYRTFPLEMIDEDQIINTWKGYLYPSAYIEDESYDFIFLAMSFYLLNEGYIVKQFPDLLLKIENSFAISDGILKNATRIKYGTDGRGAVTWRSRRSFIDELILERTNNELTLESDLEKLVQEISVRNAKFTEMTNNEKLQTIRNAFENIGKNGKKYIEIDYALISNGLITNNMILSFQKDLQCFRHGEASMIEKRESFSEESKLFMIDYGILILNLAYRELKRRIEK